MTQVRKAPAERKAELLAAALTLAEKGGLKAVTRIGVAEATGTTDGLINRYFAGRTGMRSEVLAEAVRLKKVPLLAHALHVEGFELPANMPRQLERDVKKAVAELAEA